MEKIEKGEKGAVNALKGRYHAELTHVEGAEEGTGRSGVSSESVNFAWTVERTIGGGRRGG